MKIIKKMLVAVIIAITTFLIVPVTVPLSELGYTVEATSSQRVYVTPTGKRYHYKSTCGGKNSTASTLSRARARGLTPCQKCVHYNYSYNNTTSSTTTSKTKIKINKTKYTMNKGQTYTLKISGTKKKVTWSTSNKKVATVSSKGKVTAKKNGTATITAKVGSKKLKCKITVKDPSINKTKICIAKGYTYTLKVKDTNQKIKWSTSNKKVATVSSKGKITAKKAGTATITAKVGSKKLKCKVAVETMYISKTKITLEEENTYTLKVKDTKQDVKWSSSDKNVATVNSKGKVTAKKAGTATITAKVGEKKLKCKVTVNEPDYAKYISTSYTKLANNSLLISMKNTGSKKIDYVAIDIKFYKNGSLIGSRSTNTVCLQSGRTAYNSVLAPYDSNYETLDYDSIKITITDANIYQYVPYKDLYKNISVTSNKSQDVYYGVIGEVTNIGSEKVYSAEIGVIYYKDNNIIGYDDTFIYYMAAGASEVVNFSKPYDSNYDDIEFDSYKVVINYAYAY